MGERKVLNKYFPPDFDPRAVPRFRRKKDAKIEIRMMLPFSVCCGTCGHFMYQGKKFNSVKEYCEGEDYLNIKRWRLYFKCEVCKATFTIKTDPKNADYEMEAGATRNFQLWKAKEREQEEDRTTKEELEESGDAMTKLENRTIESRLEMDSLDALDELRLLSKRNERLSHRQVLDKLRASGNAKASDGGVAYQGTQVRAQVSKASISKYMLDGEMTFRLIDARKNVPFVYPVAETNLIHPNLFDISDEWALLANTEIFVADPKRGETLFIPEGFYFAQEYSTTSMDLTHAYLNEAGYWEYMWNALMGLKLDDFQDMLNIPRGNYGRNVKRVFGEYASSVWHDIQDKLENTGEEPEVKAQSAEEL